jgi:DNA-directed RNA polymerase subunit omega
MIWAILRRVLPGRQDPVEPESAPNLPKFAIASAVGAITFSRSTEIVFEPEKIVNSEYCRLALLKVGNPNTLINLVSRRVRQLNSGGGTISRPLLNDVTGLGAADIALKEIIEEKMGWENPADLELTEPAPKKRKRS